MKRILVAMALIISMILVMGCKSTSSPPTDNDYKKLYDKNTGLILDGAAEYTVKSGDTLSHISHNQYGNGLYYPIIMLASRGVVINPDKIEPGMKLTLPDLEKNKADANARKSMKNCLSGYSAIEKTKEKPDQSLITGFQQKADEL